MILYGEKKYKESITRLEHDSNCFIIRPSVLLSNRDTSMPSLTLNRMQFGEVITQHSRSSACYINSLSSNSLELILFCIPDTVNK